MTATHTATIPESDVSNDNDDNNSANNVVDLTDGVNSSKYLQTTIAEIIWTLFSVTKGFSNNSATDISATFAEISAIASNFHLGKGKLKYLTNWGIAPYIKEQLKDEIAKSEYIVVSFDFEQEEHKHVKWT